MKSFIPYPVHYTMILSFKLLQNELMYCTLFPGVRFNFVLFSFFGLFVLGSCPPFGDLSQLGHSKSKREATAARGKARREAIRAAGRFEFQIFLAFLFLTFKFLLPRDMSLEVDL